MEWFNNAVIYQIYPLGYCGAERENSFTPFDPGKGKAKLLKIIEHIPEIKRLGFNAVLFNPLFESSAHGYDTADYTKVDSRLGGNGDFKAVCAALRENGIRIILDGVFNHVGREFTKFKDVREKKWGSEYKDWFHIRDGNSNYGDGFYYEGWEGHYELVKLNLNNSAVRDYLKSVISGWVAEFGIDGLRLDVAYCLDLNFLKELRAHCKGLKSDFWLMGETLHGDYNRWCNPEMLDSVTNYECYKGLYSSFNELNMFEIAYSLNRQFGKEGWTIYRGKKLLCFLDNHDVSRIASRLTEFKHLPAAYTLMFTMPGVPSVYYGSEYCQSGDKNAGDAVLRPEFDLRNYDQNCESAMLIAKLTRLHAGVPALYEGSYAQLQLLNRQFSFIRESGSSVAVTLLNADDKSFTFNINQRGEFTDALTGRKIDASRPIELPAFGAMVLVNEPINLDIPKSAAILQSVAEEAAAPAAPAESEPDEKTVKARRFVSEVKELAEKYGLPVFVVTDGASGANDIGCEAVERAKNAHDEWESER
ncbi:MAG: maltodextrin glucosidase [Oscillospiraceae bacterium]|jgi:glycosidase|nr:maltodextrin glucosidase [Oscillospiraceae bacterium]